MQRKENQQGGFFNLLERQSLLIQACQNKQYFKIRIISSQIEGEKKIYEADVNNHKEADKLFQLFDNREEILEFLKQSENVRIDLQNCSLILLGRHPTKKKEIVQLFKIDLIEVVEEDEEKMLLALKKQANLESEQIKSLLKVMLNKIEQVQKWKIDGEQFKRMVHKMQHIGNKIQSLQMKSVDLFEKFQDWGRKYEKEQYENSVMISKIRDQINREGLKIYQLEEWKHQFETNYKNQIEEDRKDLQNQQAFNKNLESEINQLKKLLGIRRPQVQEEQVQRIRPPVDALNVIDSSAKYYKHFRIKGNDIIKQSDFLFPTILVGLKHIQNNDTFGIKINRMGILQKIYPGVCVGIIDSRLKNKQYCEDNDNVIQFGCTGKLYEGNKLILSQKQGYQINDTVQVIVNFSQPCVEWFVNKKLKCSYKNQKLLKNRQIEWRPYVFMRDKGDSISWIL